MCLDPVGGGEATREERSLGEGFLGMTGPLLEYRGRPVAADIIARNDAEILQST
jgi:hypothetical protein